MEEEYKKWELLERACSGFNIAGSWVPAVQ